MQRHFIPIYCELIAREISFNIKKGHIYFKIGEDKFIAKSQFCVLKMTFNESTKKIEFQNLGHLSEVLLNQSKVLEDHILDSLSHTLEFGEYQYCPLIWIVQNDPNYLKMLIAATKSSSESYNKFRRDLRRTILYLKKVKNISSPEVFSKNSEINN